MNQLAIGQYITKKRKQKNFTQEQLGEKLGVSNKTISKWENGRCMPDYSVIEPLCKELGISVAELLDGEEAEDKSIRTYDDFQILDLIKRTQTLENQRTVLYGLILLIMGIALLVLHYNIGGSNFRGFLSGMLLGLSICEMLVGIFIVTRGLAKQ